MKSSTTKYTIASIIPGLGYFLLGKRKQAINSFIWVLIPLLLYFVLPWSSVRELCLALAIFMWYFQFSSMRKVAKALSLPENRSLYLEQEEIQYPPGLPRRERLIYVGKELLRRQLKADEELLEIVYGHQAFHWYYISLTQHNLIFVETDINAKPVNIKRVPYTDVREIKCRSNLMSQHLSIVLHDGDTWDFEVPAMYRKDLQVIVSKLEKSESKTVSTDETSSFEWLTNTIQKMDTGLLFIAPLLLGGVVVYGWVELFSRYQGTAFDTFVWSFVLFCFGLSGFVIFVRKESPGLRPRRGLEPIIFGILTMLLWWGGAIYLWVKFLFNL